MFYSIDREEEDDTWNPDMETQSVSSLEASLEDATREVDTDDDDDSDDPDFRPCICVR